MRKVIITLTILALIASVVGTGVLVVFETQNTEPTEQNQTSNS